jgi:hypothetical protein
MKKAALGAALVVIPAQISPGAAWIAGQARNDITASAIA